MTAPRVDEHAIDLATLALPPQWTAHALCAQIDHDGFFPHKGQSNNAAIKACGMCSVRKQCLDFALEHEEPHGIWGGLMVKQRRPLVRARRLERSRICALEGCEALVDQGAPNRRYCSPRHASRAASIRYERKGRTS